MPALHECRDQGVVKDEVSERHHVTKVSIPQIRDDDVRVNQTYFGVIGEPFGVFTGFSTRVQSTNKKENKIKNQLITCSREEKWKSKISPTEKTNPSPGYWCLGHFEGCVSELEDAKEFRKYLLRMKEKNQNFFFELKLEVDQSIKIAFSVDARSKATCEYFGDVISFNTTYNTNTIYVNLHQNPRADCDSVPRLR
ncbi:hypothetical protein Ahy_B08g092061 isoform A [Arachis hypogaea]|uniref:Protein FAR1-RELATED SEQUENCE n=1 Tax=Arachis hypogaea TaxID=3818 RepID=A0A444Y361_ARAHY|nr:hypothetical protein Ahy_B08g092061 isoform A [Arachis hypogaea]